MMNGLKNFIYTLKTIFKKRGILYIIFYSPPVFYYTYFYVSLTSPAQIQGHHKKFGTSTIIICKKRI